MYHYTVKAIAPDGQYTVGVGSCDSREISDESRREHFTQSRAHTRGKNRAISDLIGFGQVSAEEVTGEPKYVEAQQVKPSEEMPKAKVGPPPRKTPPKAATKKPKKDEEPPKGPPDPSERKDMEADYRVTPPAQMRSPPKAPRPVEELTDHIESVMASAGLDKVRVYPYGKRVYVDPVDIEQDEWTTYNAILSPLGAAWNRESGRWEVVADE